MLIVGHSLAIWLIFGAIVAVVLIVDLAIINRTPAPSVRRSTAWSLVLIAVAGLFATTIWGYDGRSAALQFATGYVVEFSLSVDNLLVFMIVLRYFAVPAALQPTVLKWGILGAIVMRGLVIATGTVILREFHWVIYLFGVLLIVTAIRMLAKPDDAGVDPGSNPVVRMIRRILPVSDRFAASAFVVRINGKLQATPLLLVVLVMEWTDLIFATDSIPAIFAITRDPFLIYTSNVLAIIGLRALFLVLAALLMRFAYLRFGVATVLLLVGVKMLLTEEVRIPSLVSLAAVVGVLGLSVVASLARPSPE